MLRLIAWFFTEGLNMIGYAIGVIAGIGVLFLMVSVVGLLRLGNKASESNYMDFFRNGLMPVLIFVAVVILIWAVYELRAWAKEYRK